MERIISRFDHPKQTIPDILQRPMLNCEPLLDNQEVCMMLQVSQQTNFATLSRFRNSDVPYHLSQDMVSEIRDNCLYWASFHREQETEEKEK